MERDQKVNLATLSGCASDCVSVRCCCHGTAARRRPPRVLQEEEKTAGDHKEQLWPVRLHGAASRGRYRDATLLDFLTDVVTRQPIRGREKKFKLWLPTCLRFYEVSQPVKCSAKGICSTEGGHWESSAVPVFQLSGGPLVLSAAVGGALMKSNDGTL